MIIDSDNKELLMDETYVLPSALINYILIKNEGDKTA